CLKRGQASRTALARHLDGFKSVSEFAAPRLAQALRDHYGPGLDVHQDRLRHVHILAAATLGSPRQENIVVQSLLQAALQNFERGETGPFGFDRGSAILRKTTLPLRHAITPRDFASLARQLDLGGQYKQHIEGYLLSSETGQPGRYRQLFEQQQRDELALQAEIALLQGHLDPAAHQMLQSLLDPARSATWHGQPVTCSYLTLLDFANPGSGHGALLKGVLLIEGQAPAGSAASPCVLYLADDPQEAVRQYASRQAVHDALRERLRRTRYQAFFKRYVHVRSQPVFFQALAERLSPPDRASGQRKPAADADLHLRAYSLGDAPLDEFCVLQTVKRLDDARITAVPTDDEDRKTRNARLASLLGWTENLLFLVPGLGEAMLAVAGGQLIMQIFNGIEQWQHHQREQAVLGFLGVVLNLELLGLGTALHADFEGADFIGGLHPIEPAPGKRALWKPDLGPYRHDLPDLPGNRPDAAGLTHQQGAAYLGLEGHHYRLGTDNGVNRFHLRHPENPDAYAPLLRHNGKGAWQLEFERPWQWQRPQLFSRLGPDAASLDPGSAERVLQASGIDDSLLRRMHMDLQAPPALLQDSLVRFRLDQDLANLIRRLRSGGAGDGSLDELHMELQLLTSEPVWPPDRVLRLLDRKRAHIQEYPVGQPAQVSRIDLQWPGLDANRLLGKVLEGLDESEIRSLLDEEFGAGPFSLQTRTANLRRKLAAQAIERRQALFDSHYRYRTQSTLPAAALIQRDFPGLSTAIAEELANHAQPLEIRQLLASRRLPLRLAEEARHYLRAQRLTRAIEGLYMPSVHNPDSDRLILRLLRKLPGWPAQVHLEIRERTFAGALLDSLGDASASIRKVLVRNSGRYDTYDASGQDLHAADDLYASVLHALPDAERQALGFPGTHEAEGLRRHLLQQPLPPRRELEALLGLPAIRPGYRPPMRLADGRVGFPLSGRGVGAGSPSSRSQAFIELAERLFPDNVWQTVQAFLGLRGLNEGAAVRRLEQLQAEYDTLSGELDAWVGAAPGSTENERVRSQVADSIRRCWQRAPAYTSSLGGYHFSLFAARDMMPLPILSADFSHVSELTLFHGPSSVPGNLDAFLGRFPQVRQLSLRGGVLSDIPSTLESMAQLRHLDLSNNRIVLTPENAARLSTLTRLRRLDLSRNPTLGHAPDFSSMSQLVYIYLNHCELDSWPSGFERLRGLVLLDLRANRLARVPARLLNTSQEGQRIARAINLMNNPIENLDEVADYYDETDIDLNLALPYDLQEEDLSSDDEPAHSPHSPRDPVSRDETAWLQDLDPRQQEDFRNDWMQLAGEGLPQESEAFFRVIDDLRTSADYGDTLIRPRLLDKVRRMVRAAVRDTALREKLLLRANAPQADACADGITVVFSDMGLDVLEHEAYAQPSPQRIEASLLELARGKSRLERVNRQARAEIDRRVAEGLTPDEAEVYLAYRIGLAERLNLPWQASKMQFRSIAHVEPTQLDAAYAAIVEQEKQPMDRIREALRQPFWKDYLEVQYLQELDEKKALRANKGSALEDLYSAQQRWFADGNLPEAEKARLKSAMQASARLLGRSPTQVFARSMTDAEYQAVYTAIAREYEDELERLTGQCLREQRQEVA
uniref:dermonecrotic toxin domain-containing protein n=1 Tax=Pseudomonas asplenii TaxID=53407 RepID=UPI00036B6174